MHHRHIRHLAELLDGLLPRLAEGADLRIASLQLLAIPPRQRDLFDGGALGEHRTKYPKM